MKKDTVLFDFDGTLMDTSELIINSWQHTFRTLEGVERSEKEIIATMGEPLAITMKKKFPNVPVEESISIYRGYHYDNFTDMISIFPGIKKLLEELKLKRYTLGVVTSRLLGTTKQGMREFGLDTYFDAVVTAEDVTEHKPHPQPIEIALKRLNKGVKQSIMVGDTMYDILSAKNAGVVSVLVGWSLAVSERDRNVPDYIIDEPNDIWEVLDV